MEKLVASVLKGEKGAATRFYRECSPAIRKYLNGRLGSNEEVDEILQDVFLSALDSLPLYRGDSSLKTWLLSIARHEVADYYRKRYVRRAVERTGPLFEGMLSEMTSPEFEINKLKMRKKFMRAYRNLSQAYQDILSYRFELGMSVKEIAVRMSLSDKATESMLYRARLAFRYEYEKI